jgi:perosamine synthetase
LLEEKYSGQKDALLEKTNSLGIMTRPAWTPLHKLEIYKEVPKAPLNIVESLSRRIVNIPSGVDLK